MTRPETLAPSGGTRSANDVRGALTFIVPQETKPYFESSALTGGEPRVHFETETRRVDVRDMRRVADMLSLDREGFLLVSHKTAVADLYDDEAIATVYDRELEALLADVTGADRVAVFDHTRRSDSAEGAANPDGFRAPKVVLGPGTGFGAAALLPEPGGGWRAVCGEGGHMTLAAANEAEAVLLAGLREEFGHVSVERVVSGPGLALLYRVLSGNREPAPEPKEVTARAAAGEPLAVAAIGHFARFLATAASDLALVFAAKGGVYLSGGILPRLGPCFDRAAYLDRFADKGRFRAFLRSIPSAVVTRPAPALAGLAAAAFQPPGQE